MTVKTRQQTQKEQQTALTWLNPLHSLLTDWSYFPLLATLLLIFEAISSVVIVFKIPYTEIDWVAYMQEVSGFLAGERDYLNIRGDTGPLVYPAGFLYLYSGLYYLTKAGQEIVKAQYVFCGLYVVTQAIVLGIYHRSKIGPPWIVIPIVLSKRIHSLYMLRLFNDCFAAAFAYAAILLFCKHRWKLGCLIFSLGVSIKMNVLLFAPGLLLLLLKNTGVKKTTICLSICAAVQLALGSPFLLSHPISYISKAFELSRVFLYSETVNLKFLPEEVFVSKPLASVLLTGHIGTLVLAYFRLRGSALKSPKDIFFTLALSNFIGVVFARTLHYQFYTWYFHGLPALVYFALTESYLVKGWTRNLHYVVFIMLLVGIEVCFNIYRATPWSSALLQSAHCCILLMIMTTTKHKKIS